MAKTVDSGNVISEWYGQRIYPVVRLDVAAISGKNSGQCPFLSEVLGTPSKCTKNHNSQGVCTVSSVSNGPRQDWLVCPYRVIASDMVRQACKRIFGLTREVTPVPVSILIDAARLEQFTSEVNLAGAGYLFFQDKLGGEISLTGTDRSPELSFDVTLVEVQPDSAGGYKVSRYGILEIQTMDYHGSYKAAVDRLRNGLELHEDRFASMLGENLERWAGKDMEGPNVANVFKRTFYQMLLKFRLAGEAPAAAGTVLALPQSVWDSWQPFLGAPELENETHDVQRIKGHAGSDDVKPLNSFICIFDLDSASETPVSPVRVVTYVRVSPERLTHHAFTEVPATLLSAIQGTSSIMTRIQLRLGTWWSAFRPSRNPPTRRKGKSPLV